ncbi:MAG: hypothetical protein Q9217_000665 [Psora testacea]
MSEGFKPLCQTTMQAPLYVHQQGNHTQLQHIPGTKPFSCSLQYPPPTQNVQVGFNPSDFNYSPEQLRRISELQPLLEAQFEAIDRHDNQTMSSRYVVPQPIPRNFHPNGELIGPQPIMPPKPPTNFQPSGQTMRFQPIRQHNRPASSPRTGQSNAFMAIEQPTVQHCPMSYSQLNEQLMGLLPVLEYNLLSDSQRNAPGTSSNPIDVDELPEPAAADSGYDSIATTSPVRAESDKCLSGDENRFSDIATSVAPGGEVRMQIQTPADVPMRGPHTKLGIQLHGRMQANVQQHTIMNGAQRPRRFGTTTFGDNLVMNTQEFSFIDADVWETQPGGYIY